MSESPTLSGWGNVPVAGVEIRSENLARVAGRTTLTRGLGRSYGDSSLPPTGVDAVAGSTLADRLLSFDSEQGVVRAEAGLALRDLIRIVMPRGWFPAVVPGTQFVTLGGMVAADVHGKNHHRNGTIGRWLEALLVLTADGQRVETSRDAHPDLFWATIGGMGLTGHILEVEMRLEAIASPWILGEIEIVPDIEAFIRGLKSAGEEWPFTAGWIDCLSRGRRLGRGVLIKGRWAEASEAPEGRPQPKKRVTVPFTLPNWTLNRWSLRLMNEVYFRRQSLRRGQSILHPEEFFFPLDAVGHWNRIYGKRGMTQYQCVLPEPEPEPEPESETGPSVAETARRFLNRFIDGGGLSFLSVIKDCGEQGEGLLSFPRPGISIALDIPLDSGTQDLVDRLNELVIEAGGRIYLAKDLLTRAEHFATMEGRLDCFFEARNAWDREGRLASAQSERLFEREGLDDQPGRESGATSEDVISEERRR